MPVAIFSQFLANLRQGVRLVLLRPPRPVANLGQLILLLALGWACMLLGDRSEMTTTAMLAPWGVASAAARGYAWLALLALLALVSRGRLEFLPLAVALAAADGVLWVVWYGVGLLLPALPAAAAEFAGAQLWRLFLCWQVAVFAVAAWSLGSLQRQRLVMLAPLVGLYAGGLYASLNLLPDYPLWEEPAAVATINVEETYSRQPWLTGEALAGVTPGVPGRRELFVVSFAGYGGQDVFRREAEQVSAILGRQYGAEDRVVTLINNPATVDEYPLASRSNLRLVLGGLAGRMQPDEDILFLFLTSHGAEDGEFSVELGDLGLNPLGPEDLRDLLDEAGIRWRVVVVSACYSGFFADALGSPETLLITAAARDRTSFGCEHRRRWTYFGAAYFRDALSRTRSFVEAFDRAATAVARRERVEGLPPSMPQMALGAKIRPLLEVLVRDSSPDPATRIRTDH